MGPGFVSQCRYSDIHSDSFTPAENQLFVVMNNNGELAFHALGGKRHVKKNPSQPSPVTFDKSAQCTYPSTINSYKLSATQKFCSNLCSIFYA